MKTKDTTDIGYFFFFFPVLKNIESLFIKTIDIALVCTKGRGKN